MPIDFEPGATLIRDDDEGLFSRDINGQLVRLDAPTESDYDKTVTLQIDGQSVTVPLAEPQKDANGNIVLDVEGRTTPRYTTIFDAALKLYVNEPGDETRIPIPVLCHQPHMKPVAVCRLCTVQIYGQKRGKRSAERKLLPACQHQVKDAMEVFTMKDPGPDGDRVRQSVEVLTSLLAADHLKPAALPDFATELASFNELGRVATRVGADPTRFQNPLLNAPAPATDPHRARRKLDASSPVFMIDHTACILCDRCVRACGEVMDNQVIGRTGKGAHTGIGFDLNDPMGKSSCVQCGECMVSCPTTAITFKPIAQVKLPARKGRAEIIPAAQLAADPDFAGIPPKFLLWQQGLVVRRQLAAHETLFHRGDAGNTACIIKSGRLEAIVHRSETSGRPPISAGGKRDQESSVLRVPLTAANLIVGEMACLTGTSRNADVVALEPSEVWEVRRNVLDRLMRLPNLRAKFEHEYRARSLDLALQDCALFRELPSAIFGEIVEFLRHRISFVSVSPGQVIFRQGDPVADMYLIRLGYIRVSIERGGVEAKVIPRGPGTLLGEIGLLRLSPEDIRRSIEEIDHAIETALAQAGDDLAHAMPSGVRSANCRALGHVELARLSRVDSLEMVRRFPLIRRRLIEQSLGRLRSDNVTSPILTEYVQQGLYEGRSILVLDMDLCTRCDECTKGCIEQHGTESHGFPITRLLRDGLRFENFLVATSCRSCANASCMVGCPVDAIHRGRHQQMVIEDHCIGCGLCASNCPFGSIFMVPNGRNPIPLAEADAQGNMFMVSRPKAATCDLCDSGGHQDNPKPRCVAACPHEAASRVSGDELLKLVGGTPH